jgi:HprK-related kinase B
MRIPENTACRLAEKIRGEAPAAHELRIRLDDTVLSVSCSTFELAQGLNAYFSDFSVFERAKPDIRVTVHETAAPEFCTQLAPYSPEPGKTKIKEMFADIPGGRLIQKRQTGLAFILGPDIHLAVGPCAANLNQVINFINTRFIEAKLARGGLLAHAAGVCRNGRGLGIAGFSGSGKSSLALKMLSRGCDFISNDRLILLKNNPGCRMIGVAKHPRVNPGTILNNPDLAGILPEPERSRYRRLPQDALWNLDEKYDVRIESAFPGRRFLLNTPMTGFVILNWKRTDAAPSLQPADPAIRRDLLAALIKQPGIFCLPSGEKAPRHFTEPDYIEALSACDVFELAGGVDFEAAADRLSAYLESGTETLRKAK